MQNEYSFSVVSAPYCAEAWQHTLPQIERERLDNLMGLALLDRGVHDRLLIQRDPSLLDDFNISEDTRHWLTNVKASTLREFAQAIVEASKLAC